MSYQASPTLSLGLPDIRIVNVRLAREQELVVEVESALSAIDCHRCRRAISEFDGYAEPQIVQHAPSSGQVVLISFRPKRFRCPYCSEHPTTTQQLRWPLADMEKQVGG